jgi:FMN phosphatase YigB (HAD superfamily)
MIGDNLITDMGGARNAKVDHVFFNPNRVKHEEPVTYEIVALSELRNIL